MQAVTGAGRTKASAPARRTSGTSSRGFHMSKSPTMVDRSTKYLGATTPVEQWYLGGFPAPRSKDSGPIRRGRRANSRETRGQLAVDISERREAGPDGVADELGGAAGAELPHRVRAVALHRRDAHEESGRDLGGPPSFTDELKHLAL